MKKLITVRSLLDCSSSLLRKAGVVLLGAVLSIAVLASPAQQEKQQLCAISAQGAIYGNQIREAGATPDQFAAVVERMKQDWASDSDVTPEMAKRATDGLKAGYKGDSPQAVFDACMSLKEASTL